MTELWATGEMVCLSCGYGEPDIHVWALGSEPVECPECGLVLCVPKEADYLWSDVKKTA